ncbi:hypothetical protein SLS60_010493 [Paraconiothyrium brasiliense]|uniref:Uncharacterized protein n=1 Tax=Paraconiothyrium brasiliense TaxID=300254 RepID=A0ABR3QNN1_9PLEO
MQLRNQISLVLLELSYLEQFGAAESLETFLPTGELRLLLHAMQIAQNEIAATHEELRLTANPLASKTTTSARLTWALFDRKSVGGALAQLERVEGRLICLLQLVNLRMSIDLRRDNVTFGTQILDERKTQRMQTVSRRPEPKESFLSAEETAIKSATVFRHNYTFILADFWSKVFGSEVELTTSNNEYQRAYDIYAKLPLPAFTGRKAFLVTLSMRRAWGFWPNVSLLGGGLNFVNIIPMESEIVAACRRGDIVAVRTLFSARKAAPNDMTSESGTLIYVRHSIVLKTLTDKQQHATESGSTKLVQFLIDAGAPLQP